MEEKKNEKQITIEVEVKKRKKQIDKNKKRRKRNGRIKKGVRKEKSRQIRIKVEKNIHGCFVVQVMQKGVNREM